MKIIYLLLLFFIIFSCNRLKQEDLQGYWILSKMEEVKHDTPKDNILFEYNLCYKETSFVKIKNDSIIYLIKESEDLVNQKFIIQKNTLLSLNKKDTLFTFDKKTNHLFYEISGCQNNLKKIDINKKITFDSVQFTINGYSPIQYYITYDKSNLSVIDSTNFTKQNKKISFYKLKLTNEEKNELNFTFYELFQSKLKSYEIHVDDSPNISIQYFRNGKSLKKLHSKENVDYESLKEFYPIIINIIHSKIN